MLEAAGVLKTVMPLALRVGLVDVVHAHTPAADHLQARAGIDQFLAHLGGAAHQQDVDPFLVEIGGELVLWDALRGDGEACCLQCFPALGGNAVVGVNALAHPFFRAKSSITSTSTCTLSIGRALYRLAR